MPDRIRRWSTITFLLAVALVFLNSCASTGDDSNPSSQMVIDPDTPSVVIGGSVLVGFRVATSGSSLLGANELTLPSGQTTFPWTIIILNTDTARTTPSTTLRYYLKASANFSSADIEIDTDVVGALGPGEDGTYSITVTPPSEAGIYRYAACVDGLRVLSRLESANLGDRGCTDFDLLVEAQ